MAREKGANAGFLNSDNNSPPSPPPKDRPRRATAHGDYEGVDKAFASDDDLDESDAGEDDPLEGSYQPHDNQGPTLDDSTAKQPLPLWAEKNQTRRRWLRPRYVLPALFLALLIAAGSFTAADPTTARDLAAKVAPGVFQGPRSRYAFATYVSGYNRTRFGGSYHGANDQFYDAARLINYQLRHAPSTRSRPDIDFVVLVHANVSQAGRDRLTREGARVVVSDPLTPKWVSDWYGDGRWSTVMDKFTLAGMTEYEKICFLDADMVIHKRLDGIFDDPATKLSPTRNGSVDPHDSPLPMQYMMAAMRDRGTSRRDNSTSDNFQYFNAGFFCWAPSTELFAYYMSVLNRTNSFLPIYPEQNLLNLVHSQASNMPFTRLNWQWNTAGPDWLDLARGIYSYHYKAWLPTMDFKSELYRIWWYQKREMEAYYADIGLQERGPEDGTGVDKPPHQLEHEPPPGFIINFPPGVEIPNLNGTDAAVEDDEADPLEAEVVGEPTAETDAYDVVPELDPEDAPDPAGYMRKLKRMVARAKGYTLVTMPDGSLQRLA